MSIICVLQQRTRALVAELGNISGPGFKHWIGDGPLNKVVDDEWSSLTEINNILLWVSALFAHLPAFDDRH